MSLDLGSAADMFVGLAADMFVGLDPRGGSALACAADMFVSPTGAAACSSAAATRDLGSAADMFVGSMP